MPTYYKDQELGFGFGEILKFFRDKGIDVKITSQRDCGRLERTIEAPSIYQTQFPFEPFRITDKGWLYVGHFSRKLDPGTGYAMEDSFIIERTYIKFIRTFDG